LRRQYLLYPEKPPAMNSFRLTGAANDQVELNWDTLLGRKYRLYSRTDFSAPWQPAGDFTGTGMPAIVTDTLDTAERFYRLELLP
jgi:hypothetical protein